MSEDRPERDDRSTHSRLRDFARPGVVGSLLLHAVVLGLLLYQIGAPPDAVPVIPVEFVQLAEQTAAPTPQPNTPAQPNAGRVASVAPPRATPQTRPAPTPPAAPPSSEQPAPDTLPPAPLDPLQTQLDALAKLRTQNSPGTRP